MNILITAALESEIKLILKYFKAEKIFTQKKISLYQMNNGGHYYLSGITGVGPRNIRRFVQYIKDLNITFDLWISTGYAGGLDNRLKAGDIVIGDQSIITPGFNNEITIPCILQKIPEKYSYKTFQVYSSRDFLDNNRKKEVVGQYPGAGFADMESFEISSGASSLKIPLFIIRSITDGLEFIPPPPEFIRDSFRKINWPGFLIAGFRNPSVFISFIQLLRNIKKAGKSLFKGLTNIITELSHEN